MRALNFREITAADVPALFYVRTRTRENTLTLEELQRLGINPQSVAESLGKTTNEGKGVGGRLMALAEGWLAASGCKRAWLTTDLDITLRVYGFYRKRGWADWKIERGLRWMELGLPP